MSTKLTTAFDPDIICSLATDAYQAEINRQFDYAKCKTAEAWFEPFFDSLNLDHTAFLNLNKDTISIITQIRHHSNGKKKLTFGHYSNFHDNHGSLAKLSETQTWAERDMVTTYKEMPNVDNLVTTVDNVEDIMPSIKMVEDNGLCRAFIPIHYP